MCRRQLYEVFARAANTVPEVVALGRSTDARASNDKERRATIVLKLAITEASAKIRVGGPKDDAEDMARRIWAGVIPLRTVAGDPVREPDCDVAAPAYVAAYLRP